MLPTDEETRYTVLEALYEIKRLGRDGLSFNQMHDKLHIPWPILWFNLDYLEEEQLIIRRKPEEKSGSTPSIYEVSEKGQNVIEYKEEYTEKYPFLTSDESDCKK